jgi:hypothetical protein
MEKVSSGEGKFIMRLIPTGIKWLLGVSVLLLLTGQILSCATTSPIQPGQGKDGSGYEQTDEDDEWDAEFGISYPVFID